MERVISHLKAKSAELERRLRETTEKAYRSFYDSNVHLWIAIALEGGNNQTAVLRSPTPVFASQVSELKRENADLKKQLSELKRQTAELKKPLSQRRVRLSTQSAAPNLLTCCLI